MTLLLVGIPMIYFFFAEFSLLPISKRALVSLFQSVTLRTAGFNTVDIASLNDTSKLIMIGIMLVGGAPGSTAGGMKITTLAVIMAAAFAVFKRRDSAQMFKRRIDDSTVRHALAIVMLYLFLFIFSAFAIFYIDGLPLIDCLFETASAIATVGITTGITTSLSSVSRIIIMLLMFFGRVGGLTLIYATLSGSRYTSSKLPVEKIIVG
jgi:trk system potassium uptake protein TrkH